MRNKKILSLIGFCLLSFFLLNKNTVNEQTSYLSQANNYQVQKLQETVPEEGAVVSCPHNWTFKKIDGIGADFKETCSICGETKYYKVDDTGFAFDADNLGLTDIRATFDTNVESYTVSVDSYIKSTAVLNGHNAIKVSSSQDGTIKPSITVTSIDSIFMVRIYAESNRYFNVNGNGSNLITPPYTDVYFDSKDQKTITIKESGLNQNYNYYFEVYSAHEVDPSTVSETVYEWDEENLTCTAYLYSSSGELIISEEGNMSYQAGASAWGTNFEAYVYGVEATFENDAFSRQKLDNIYKTLTASEYYDVEYEWTQFPNATATCTAKLTTKYSEYDDKQFSITVNRKTIQPTCSAEGLYYFEVDDWSSADQNIGPYLSALTTQTLEISKINTVSHNYNLNTVSVEYLTPNGEYSGINEDGLYLVVNYECIYKNNTTGPCSEPNLVVCYKLVKKYQTGDNNYVYQIEVPTEYEYLANKDPDLFTSNFEVSYVINWDDDNEATLALTVTNYQLMQYITNPDFQIDPYFEFTIPADDYEYEIVEEPTCTTAGSKRKIALFNFDPEIRNNSNNTIDIPATGHDYEVTYEWGMNYRTCVAIITCKNNPSETVQLSSTVNVETVTEATCQHPGLEVCEARFNNVPTIYQELISNQTKERVLEQYECEDCAVLINNVQFRDDGIYAHTWLLCEHCGKIFEEKDVKLEFLDRYDDYYMYARSITSELFGDEQEFTAMALITYTTELTKDYPILHLTAINPYYLFGVELSETLQQYLTQTEYTGTMIGTYTKEVLVPATCLEGGRDKCTAHFVLDENIQPSEVFDSDPLGHDYHVTYEWEDDYSLCTARVVCSHDEKHNCDFRAAGRMIVDQEATCSTAGLKHYEAAFEDIGDFAELIRTQVSETFPIPKRSHLENKFIAQIVEFTENGVSLHFKVLCRWCAQEGRNPVIIEQTFPCTKLQELDRQVVYGTTVSSPELGIYNLDVSINVNYSLDWTNEKPVLTVSSINEYYSDSEAQTFGSLIGPSVFIQTFEGTVDSETISVPTCISKGEEKLTAHFTFDPEYTPTKTVIIDESGHDYSEEITKQPTCSETGIKTKTCSKCGNVVTETIEALGHTYKYVAQVDPSCTSDGVKAHYVCERCNKIFDENFNEITAADLKIAKESVSDHEYIKHLAKGATCTEGGWVEYYECSKCHHLFIKRGNNYVDHTSDKDVAIFISPTGHDTYTVYKNGTATCTENGTVEIHTICRRCGETIDVETIVQEALGHDYYWSYDIKPTSTTPGLKTKRCSRCGEILETIEVAPLNDLPVEEKKAEVVDVIKDLVIYQPVKKQQESEQPAPIDTEKVEEKKNTLEEAIKVFTEPDESVEEEKKEELLNTLFEITDLVNSTYNDVENELNEALASIDTTGKTEEEIEEEKAALQQAYEDKVEVIQLVTEASVVVGAKETTAAEEGAKINEVLPQDDPVFDLKMDDVFASFYANQMSLLLGKSNKTEVKSKAKGPVVIKLAETPNEESSGIDFDISKDVYSQVIDYVDTSVSNMTDAALIIRECSGESVKLSVKNYITKVSTSTFQDFDVEKANEEFVQNAYDAILLNMQQQVLTQLEASHTSSNNSAAEDLYNEQVAAVTDLETFEIMVLEVLRQKYISLDSVTNKEITLEEFEPIYKDIFRHWALNEEQDVDITLEELTTATIQTATANTELHVNDKLSVAEVVVIVTFVSLIVVAIAIKYVPALTMKKGGFAQ